MSRLLSWWPKSLVRREKHCHNRLQACELEDRSTPATLTVNVMSDIVAADGLLLIREALGAVNLGTALNLTTAEQALVSGAFGVNDTIDCSKISGAIAFNGGELS